MTTKHGPNASIVRLENLDNSHYKRISMNRILFIIAALILVSSAAIAQPRPVETSTKQPASTPAAPPAPASFEAKYEGGMFGFNQKEVGTLKFDDENRRLV